MKKRFVLLLALILVLSVLPAAVSAEEEHAPFLSFRWLDDTGSGHHQTDSWMYDGNDWCNGYTGWGCTPGDCVWQVYYLNTWNPETERYDATPVHIQVSDNLILERLIDGDYSFKPGAVDTEYYYRIEVKADAWDQNGVISYTMDDGTVVTMEAWFSRGEAGFYTSSVLRNETWMIGDYYYDRIGGEEHSFYFGFQSDYWTLDRVEPVVGWLGFDGRDTDEVFQVTKVNQNVYKITLDPFVLSTGYSFEVGLNLWLTDPEGNSNNGDWYLSKWCHNDWDNEQTDAQIWINNEGYLFYDVNGETRCYQDWLTDYVNNDNGDQVWSLTEVELPQGVSYDLATNTLTLNNAQLQRLELSGWEQDLPNEHITVELIGENTITCDYDRALMLRGGVQANFTGDGSLYVYAENKENTHEDGSYYSFPAMDLNDGAAITLSGNADMTVQIAGSALETCWDGDAVIGVRPSGVSAIQGNGDSLTIRDNASLTTVVPEGSRENGPRVPEDQVIWDDRYPGGFRGICDMGTIRVEGGSLNTQEIVLGSRWNEYGQLEWVGSYIQTGGEATIHSRGSYGDTEKWVWDEEAQEDVYLGVVDHYHYNGLGSHDGGYIEISGGVLNVGCYPTEEEIASSAYGNALFTGSQLDGEIIIRGGTVNAEISCGTAVSTNRLTVSGGTLNASNVQGDAIYAEREIHVTGGTVNATSSGGWALNLVDADMTVTGGTVNVDGTIFVGHWGLDPERPGYNDGTLTVSGGKLVQKSNTEREFFVQPAGSVIFNGDAVVEMDRTWLNLNGPFTIADQAAVEMTNAWVNAQSEAEIVVDGGTWDISGTWDFREEENEWPTAFWTDRDSVFTINGGEVTMTFTDYVVALGMNGDFNLNDGTLNVELINENTGYFLTEDGYIINKTGIALAGKGQTTINGGKLNLTGYVCMELGVDEWSGNFNARLQINGGEIQLNAGFRGMEIWSPVEINGGVVNGTIGGIIHPMNGYRIGQGISMWANEFEAQGAGSSLTVNGGRIYFRSETGEKVAIYGLVCNEAVATFNGGTMLFDTAYAVEGMGPEDRAYIVVGESMDIIDVEHLEYKEVLNSALEYSWTDENGEEHPVRLYCSTVEYDNEPGNFYTGEGVDECANLLITDYGCGEDLRWALNDGAVTISGSGAMVDYDLAAGISAPWFELREFVTSITLEEGVTHLGQDAFRDCVGLGQMTLPVSVASIGDGAFGGSDLTEILFQGDAPAFGERVFEGITVTARYPATNGTWNSDVRQNYGGTVNWVGEGAAYLPGDINNDGKVNNRDAARLMQYLAGWEVEVVEAAMDVNGDGRVNNRDAARLMQYLAGWDVKIS